MCFFQSTASIFGFLFTLLYILLVDALIQSDLQVSRSSVLPRDTLTCRLEKFGIEKGHFQASEIYIDFTGTDTSKTRQNWDT